MSSELPPNPQAYGNNLKAWANQLYEYFLSQAKVTESANPQPVLLPYQVTNVMARASQAGILLFDPVKSVVIFSDGTSYLDICTVPSYTATEIADATSDANTRNKSAGNIIHDSTNETLAVANGAGATDTWSRLTVATTVTPS